MTICKNCGQNPAIRNSHILPEFMYKNLYNHKRQLAGISPSNKGNLRFKQSGTKEPMLCTGCELELSKVEKYSAELLRQLKSDGPMTVPTTKLNERLVEVSGYNFQYFKRFVLSLFWRASVSTHEDFVVYDLKEHAESVRSIVFGETECTRTAYPVFIARIALALPGAEFILTNKLNDYKGMTSLNIDAFGFAFNLLASPNYSDAELGMLFLEPNRLMVQTINFESLNVVNQIAPRMQDSDVESFYRDPGAGSS